MDFKSEAVQSLCKPEPIQFDFNRTPFESEQAQFNLRWHQYALCPAFKFDTRCGFDSAFEICYNCVLGYNSEFESDYDSEFDTGLALDLEATVALPLKLMWALMFGWQISWC